MATEKVQVDDKTAEVQETSNKITTADGEIIELDKDVCLSQSSVITY